MKKINFKNCFKKYILKAIWLISIKLIVNLFLYSIYSELYQWDNHSFFLMKADALLVMNKASNFEKQFIELWVWVVKLITP